MSHKKDARLIYALMDRNKMYVEISNIHLYVPSGLVTSPDTFAYTASVHAMHDNVCQNDYSRISMNIYPSCDPWALTINTGRGATGAPDPDLLPLSRHDRIIFFISFTSEEQTWIVQIQ